MFYGWTILQKSLTFTHLPYTPTPFLNQDAVSLFPSKSYMKNILIIGGSSGIGAEIIQQLQGKAQIYTASRSPQNSGVAASQVWDVTDGELDTDWLPDTIDGLVYCPGTIQLKPVNGLKMDTFREDMEVNFFGAVKSVKGVLRKLKKSDDAQIIFFSTVAVQKGIPFHASIASAKGAIEGLTRSLAAELAPKIKVNCIAPSLTDTPLAEKLLSNEDRRQNANDRHPLKRVGRPDDIASLATYLLLQNHGWISGQILGVDGGMSAM